MKIEITVIWRNGLVVLFDTLGIKMQRDAHSENKIPKIALYGHRISTYRMSPYDGRWQYKTEDINKYRKKDYLYLVWNETSV